MAGGGACGGCSAVTAEPYCASDRCGHCFLHPGSEEDSRYCDQHGEGWLNDLSPVAQRRYQTLRDA